MTDTEREKKIIKQYGRLMNQWEIFAIEAAKSGKSKKITEQWEIGSEGEICAVPLSKTLAERHRWIDRAIFKLSNNQHPDVSLVGCFGNSSIPFGISAVNNAIYADIEARYDR